jgi:hypothetical protein
MRKIVSSAAETSVPHETCNLTAPSHLTAQKTIDEEIQSDEAVIVQLKPAQKAHFPFTNGKLEWTSHPLPAPIKGIVYNKGIEQWMSYSTDFANWVRTCIIQHMTLDSIKETRCPVPDRFIEDLGVKYITIETFHGDSAKKNMGVHRGLGEGVVHVFN